NTGKLELPSISQVHPRGTVDASWYNSHYTPRPAVSSERLPGLPQIQHASSSTSSSPRGGSFSSGSVGAHDSVGSATSYSSSVNGNAATFKTPSPESTPHSTRNGHALHALGQNGSPYPPQNPEGYPCPEAYNMNQIQPYGDVHAQPHVPSTGPPPAMGHYQPYQSQPLPQTYSSTPTSYTAPYAYPSAPQHQQPQAYPPSSSMSSSLMPMTLPAMASNATGVTSIGGAPYNRAERPYDATGQVAPPGMKPRVTATLWEDEGSLCFQVEAKGICVARREDNHMINGTKLLNVAGMTRGRRDGILKSEKTRHVVKIGPMHLKGVWYGIPFDRALQFANKEKITELLYPLFVHDIGALLYPPNQPRTALNAGAFAATRRDARYLPQSTQAPGTPGLHHHHSMSVAAAPQPSGGISHSGRPELGRAHTFPTPPTSASSVMGMSTQGSAYEGQWSNVPGMQASGQPLSIDTGLSNARSVPTTPATTPPANAINSMQQYQTSQTYETPRQSYTAAPSQPGQYNHLESPQRISLRPTLPSIIILSQHHQRHASPIHCPSHLKCSHQLI
ncbi:apses-domain-containing protein, partial [Eremomyces bilateralis CBS 781.70]